MLLYKVKNCFKKTQGNSTHSVVSFIKLGYDLITQYKGAGGDVSSKFFLLKSRISVETMILPFRRKYKEIRARYPATY